MDPRDELAQERARRMKLEGDLAEWQNGAIQKLSPEVIAQVIQRQQLETLTFHLVKQKQLVDELNNKLKAKEKELEQVVGNLRSLEDELDVKTREIEKIKRTHETQDKPVEKELIGQRFGVSGIPTDEELDSILSLTPVQKNEPFTKTKKEVKTIKDFVLIMRRMERMKLYDAALLMDKNQDDVLLWARALERRGYLTIQGLKEKTLVATERMLKTR